MTPSCDDYRGGNPAFFRRRASDRHVELDGVRYTLHPTSRRRAELLRDGVVIAAMTRTHTGRLPDGSRTRTYEVTRWVRPADSTAAALGHLLTSHLEVGVYSCVVNTLAVLSIPFRILG